MSLKDIVSDALNLAGFNITRHPGPHLVTRHIMDFIHDNDINIVIDAGAYHGKYCKMLRDVAKYEKRIVSFEPSARSFAVLNQTMSHDPNWAGFNWGLSSSESVARLNNYAEHGNFNSLLQLKHDDAAAYGVDAVHASIEEVTLRRLDSCWDEITRGVANPRVFLKMDTQGHDTSVAAGAGACIDFVYGMQSELPAVEIYDGMTSMTAALEFYRSLGFVPIGFYPVNTPASYGVSPEFDVLLKRYNR